MPPKGKKSGSAKDNKGGEQEREEPLQAVLFADSFETRFNPFTLETPRCLLPLANTPLIEYTLELLASVGVEEVFLYCGNHTDVVEEYLNKSKWTQPTAPFSLGVIRSDSRSVGDCMRDLDQKDLIEGDFICVYGDVVANIPLDAALAVHRARREKNKNSIMTMVLREVGAYHRTKSQPMRATFVVDPVKQRCLHYEQVRPGQHARLDISKEILDDHLEVEVREDLIDCGIDICTPQVLAAYTDNFDWQLPRRGFLHGVLKDFETNGYMIHTHMVNEGYAARVKNLRAYDAISKDVVSRWTYPITPDTNLVAGQTFKLLRNNVYLEDGVQLARSSVLSTKTVVGHGTSVGEHSRISNSVIGRRCRIGKRVKIDGAYIWDDTTIGDDSVIETAIVANGTSIGQKCILEKGALLSYGVRIADGTTIRGDQRITKYTSSDAATKRASSDPKVVGENGDGYHLALDEEEEEALEGVLYSDQTIDVPLSDDDSAVSDSDEEIPDTLLTHVGTRSDSFASIASDESGETRLRTSEFHHEATASLFDALSKSENPEDMRLELRALTLSSNVEGKAVRRALAVAYTKRVAQLMEGEGLSAKEAVAAVIPPYKILISANMREVDEQVEFLLYLQTELVRKPQGEKVLYLAGVQLAEQDLCEAEGFEAWWEDERSSATEEMEAVRKDTKQLVDFLCEDDDEDESDEDDEDDEDED